MPIKTILVNLLRKNPNSDGMFDSLSKWLQGRRDVKLQRENNAGTRQVLELLPHGALLREGNSDWAREIYMPGAEAPATAVWVVPQPPPPPPALDPLDQLRPRPNAQPQDDSDGESR